MNPKDMTKEKIAEYPKDFTNQDLLSATVEDIQQQPFSSQCKSECDELLRRLVEADAEHAKWLSEMQSQTTPITPEQAKMLRPDDMKYGYDTATLGVFGIRGDAKEDPIYAKPPLFFTEQAAINRLNEVIAAQAALDKAKLSRYERQHPYMDDAQYAACVEARDWDGADLRVDALDKAKAEAEPLEWCERKKGELIEATDSIWDWLLECWQEPTGRHVGEKLECDDMGCVNFRARYRNPLWLAKHGNKGMVYNNNTDKWEPEPTKSLDDFPINKEEPAYSTEISGNAEDLTLQTSLVLNHERGKSPSKFISFSNYKGIIPSRFTLDMKNFDLPALQELINTNFVPMFRGQPKGYVTNETQPTILEEAVKCVTGPRRRDYGTPEENFGLIASLWSLQLKHEVTPMQVALCLILLKVARQANSPKRDNLVDIAGYAQCASELKGEK